MKYIKDILIIGLVILIILLRSCGGDVEPVVITKTEIKYDTITNEITNYIPKLTTRIIRQVDTVTDSLYIVKYDKLYPVLLPFEVIYIEEPCK